MKIIIQTTKGTIESPEIPEIKRAALDAEIDKLVSKLLDCRFNAYAQVSDTNWTCVLRKKELMSITLTEE